jgi:hypothetical protein
MVICLFEENLAKDVQRVSLRLFAVQIVAGLGKQIVLQFINPKQLLHGSGLCLGISCRRTVFSCVYGERITDKVKGLGSLR